MKPALIQPLFCFCSFVCLSVHADIIAVPSVLDVGPSNLTSTVTIRNLAANPADWQASAAYGSHPAWFELYSTSGTISQLSFVSIPVSIHRERVPVPGTCTGYVYFTQGLSSKTVTVIATLLAGQNGTYPVFSGDDRAYAGIPYYLNSRQSHGWLSDYFWATNLTTNVTAEGQSFLRGPSGEIIFDTPKAISISLISKDEHERESIDTRKDFKVWNSPPQVNAGGPYYAGNGATVTVVATGTDPVPDETLIYSWQFNPPYGPFTPPSLSPTSSFVAADIQSTYIVCVVSDTWTGAVGTYNGPLGGRGIAHIMPTSEEPDIELAYCTNGSWSAWSQQHTLSLPRLPCSNITVQARTRKPAGYDGPLYVEWHQNPHNPVDSLISPADTTNETLTFSLLTEPGVYHFSVIGHNGSLQSSPADIFITLPGHTCQIVAEGFQSPVPVWGAYPTLHPANTNAYGMQDDPVSIRSDIDGWLYLDRPVNASCFIELQRSVTSFEHEISNYVFDTTITPTLIPHPTFAFPVTSYPLAGQLVNKNNLTNGVPFASATLLIYTSRIYSQCNAAGGFSFGAIPKSWPIDNADQATYYLIFKKSGWSTQCIPLSPSLVNYGMMNALYTLTQTNAMITLQGTVTSSESGLPVGNARVWFGDTMVAANQDGYFRFDPLPLASSAVSQYPTHVLLAEADGYSPTRNIYYTTGTGGTINVSIDGGDVYMYGKIVDIGSGTILTNGTIEISAAAHTLENAATAGDSTLGTVSPSGYFCIRVPGGCDYITIAAHGAFQSIPVNRALTGTQPVANDILFIPEPCGALAVLILGYVLYRSAAYRRSPDVAP